MAPKKSTTLEPKKRAWAPRGQRSVLVEFEAEILDMRLRRRMPCQAIADALNADHAEQLEGRPGAAPGAPITERAIRSFLKVRNGHLAHQAATDVHLAYKAVAGSNAAAEISPEAMMAATLTAMRFLQGHGSQAMPAMVPMMPAMVPAERAPRVRKVDRNPERNGQSSPERVSQESLVLEPATAVTLAVQTAAPVTDKARRFAELMAKPPTVRVEVKPTPELTNEERKAKYGW